MKSLLAIIAAALAVLAGCSDANSEMESQFIAGCVNTGGPKSVCECTYSAMEARFGADEVTRIMQTSPPDPEAMQYLMSASLRCMAEQ